MTSEVHKMLPAERDTIVTVEIGSNGIRIKRRRYVDGKIVECHVPASVGNLTCALAEGLSETNKVIAESNVKTAENILRTYATYLDAEKISTRETIGYATETLRNVQSTEHGQQVIQRLMNAFLPYTFTILSKEDEAKLSGEAVKMDSLYLQHAVSHDKVSFVEFGGASMQCGQIITKSGKITNAISIPYGRHPLLAAQKENPDNPDVIKKVLGEALAAAKVSQSDVLYIIGGSARTFQLAACNDKQYVLKGQNNIRETLVAAARTSADDYNKHANEHVRKYGKHVAFTAKVLEATTTYFNASKLVLIPTKTSDAQAHNHYCLHVRKTTSTSESQQPAFPSGQGQLVPA